MSGIELADVAAEQAVVGAVFIKNDTLDELGPMLKPEAFTDGRLRIIFEACRALHGQGVAVDPVTAKSYLRDSGQLEGVGVAYLTELLEAVPAAANAGHYGKIVRDKWRLRQADMAGQQLLADVRRPGATVESILPPTHDKLLALLGDGGDGVATAAEAADDLTADLARIAEGGGGLIPSGIGRLDYKLGGLGRGRMTILAARPFTGKTVLAQNLALNVAGRGEKVILFSLEMGRREVTANLQCMLGGPTPGDLYRGRLSKADFEGHKAALKRLAVLPLTIIDKTRVTAPEVGALARVAAKRSKPALVIVDYLQLLAMGRRETREREVADASRELKLLSKELDCHVLLLSQLNRQAEHRPGRVPVMSDLRESGALEQDADNVLLLLRPCMSQTEAERQEREKNGVPLNDNYAVCFVSKNRTAGHTGECVLGWNALALRFSDAVPDEVADWYAEGRGRSGAMRPEGTRPMRAEPVAHYANEH